MAYEHLQVFIKHGLFASLSSCTEWPADVGCWIPASSIACIVLNLHLLWDFYIDCSCAHCYAIAGERKGTSSVVIDNKQVTSANVWKHHPRPIQMFHMVCNDRKYLSRNVHLGEAMLDNSKHHHLGHISRWLPASFVACERRSTPIDYGLPTSFVSCAYQSVIIGVITHITLCMHITVY